MRRLKSIRFGLPGAVAFSASIALSTAVAGCQPAAPRPGPPALPRPITNNAVAAVETPEGTAVFSFLGLDDSKQWDGITPAAFRWDTGDVAWREIDPVPGGGRLAATAQAVRGRVYVFGGYTVAEDGTEHSVADVAQYDPATDAWSLSAPIPVPVDDAVSGVWRDSLIVLVSGWHDTGNSSLVQLFDPAADSWRQGTPIPGPPVFGHAGGIAGNTIVYIDGTRVDSDPRRFVLEGSSWRGEIDPSNPTRIEWTRLEDHPGPGLYRAAAIGLDDRIVFLGGSDNPYNYDGQGYDGRPAEPASLAFAWDLLAARWVELTSPRTATMDHRGMVNVGGRLFVIGGMTAGQRVSRQVVALP